MPEYLYCYFSVPPILSEKRSTSARTVGRHDGAMDHNTSVQPARLTCSAKQGSSEAVVSSNSRVNFTRTLKKGQHKDATARTRQDSVCSCEGPETDKLQMNGVTHAVPSDVKLSPEVIVSVCLKSVFGIHYLLQYHFINNCQTQLLYIYHEHTVNLVLDYF